MRTIPGFVTTLLLVVPSIGVIGDDTADTYVGSGGLILPSSFRGDTRDSVARCVGCRWRLRDPCGSDVGCLISPPIPCPPDHRLLETLWSTDSGGTWQRLGAWCVGPAGPRTVTDVGQVVADQVIVRLSSVAPVVQPGRGILTQLPTVWHSGQSVPSNPISMDVAGSQVELTAVPRWSWDFGDGRRLHTSVAGSRYPDFTVSHTFRRPGRYQVRCTATWEASFMVEGLGPFPVAQQIEQHGHVSVVVREARARLVR